MSIVSPSSTPPHSCLFSFLSVYEILPYPVLSLRLLSPGVAGEIRGYNFLQSAESAPQHLTPLLSRPSAKPPPPPHPTTHPPHTNHHHGQGQRNTSSLSEKPPFVLPPALVGSLSSSDRFRKNKPARRKRSTNEDEKQILILRVWWNGVWREGQRGLRSNTQKKEKASEGRRRRGAEVMRRRANRPLMHKHVATHVRTHKHTHTTSLTEPICHG